MLNIEKYRDEISKLGLHLAKKKGKLCHCNDIACENCDFYTGEVGEEGCRKNALGWLCSEYIEKSTLTEQEWHFCMAMQTGWIVRTENGDLYFSYGKKPKKYEITWRMSSVVHLIPYHLSFDFIRWEDEEPWAVEDLLKLEVRKEEKA